MQPDTTRLEYAGFWPRVAALSIDSLIILTLAMAAADLSKYLALFPSIKWTPASLADVSSAIFIGTGIVLSIALLPAFWVWRGQSPGQITFSLKIVRSNGSRLTWRRALLRYLGYLISAAPFFMGFLWVFHDSHRQGFHDKIADTVVIRLLPVKS